MYQPVEINTEELINNFVNSGNWRLFTVRFAAAFYELKPEQAAYSAWFEFAMEVNNNMPVLIEIVDQLSLDTNGAFPKLPTIRYKYKEAIKKFVSSNRAKEACKLCNSTRMLHVVESDINGKCILLKQSDPQPVIAHASIVPCCCSGGFPIYKEYRFSPPQDENGEICVGCEFIAQREFIQKCLLLLRKQSKGE
jgi:hypothetical protein